MKMSKLIFAAFVCFCMNTVSAAAEPLVEIINSGSNKIAVSGQAMSEASLLIINPGFTETDVQNGFEGAVQFFRHQAANGGEYRFDVNMNVVNGGEYTVIVNADGAIDKTTFMFYPEEQRLAVIRRLNTLESCADVLEEAMDVFSLSGETLYKNGSKTDIIKAINAAKENCGGKFPEDMDEIYTILKKALLCAAYNSANAELTVSDNSILYTEILGLNGTDEYDDYINALSAAGRIAINSKLLAGSYTSSDEIANAFKEYVPFYAIVSCNKSGFGHVQGYLEKYADYYTRHGFLLSRVSGIRNKNSFYSALASSKAADISALADEFNSYKEAAAAQSGSGGGGGGGSVSSNPGSGAEYIVNSEPERQLPFDDIDNVEWAQSAIIYLSEKGVISGRGNRRFEPMDIVTRAEFVKMVVGAYNFSSEETRGFGDVPGDAWYAEPVRIAAGCGIISGVDENSFMPDAPVTREQGASIIARAILFSGAQLSRNNTQLFADDEQISGWAKENVYLLKDNGIVSGRDNNLFVPKDNMTRAEAARMIYGLFADSEGVDSE